MKNLNLENRVLNPDPLTTNQTLPTNYHPTTIDRKLIMTGLRFFNLLMVSIDTIKNG